MNADPPGPTSGQAGPPSGGGAAGGGGYGGPLAGGPISRRPSSGGVRLGARLVGASFVALALALLADAALGPPRLTASVLATPEAPPPGDEVRRPGENLVVVVLGAVDPAYAVRRVGAGGREPPDLFAPLGSLLGPAHFRVLGVSPIEPSSPGAVPGPLLTEEGAKMVGRGGFDLAVLGHSVPERAGRRGMAEGAARLREAGVGTLGTGTPEEPWGPLRLIVEGRRVAWLAFDSSAGAEASPAELARRVAALREEGEADAVLVAVHAGERYATAPSEPARRLFRAAADAGAD
ncbi:MAG TPA: CapA family protein, partial [Polyangiaceae bacterium]|nr:CapA family protein [Polyangiaceae bacterium]